MRSSNRIKSMRGIDLPREMNRLILNYFGVKDSLLDLSAKQVQNIINSNIHFSYARETDYNGKVDSYILSYIYILLARDNPNIKFHLHHTIAYKK